MGDKALMIVESPAKARTIGKILGSDTTVLASMGHVSDLPQRTLGVDLANDFAPQYELTLNGRKVIKDLIRAAKGVSKVFLATDPDREGEAISWHLQRLLQPATKASFHRVSYHEITKSAIAAAFANPGDVAMPLVDAQQARRVLDRIVGYQVSPLLWRNVEKGTSAGRVQSIALRLIVERERQIQEFVPVEYWTMEAVFSPQGHDGTSLRTRLTKLNGAKANITNGADAQALADALVSPDVSHRVASVTSTPRTQHAAPPFITSTLQQAAGSSLHYGTSQTMKLAQELYEGVELADGNIVGLITYMRTDSVNIAQEAQQAARKFIAAKYGPEFVPATPNRYRSGKSAQEAHEAIRPTNVELTPDDVAPYLSSPQLRLYKLIWNRFVASQMASAKQVDHAIEIASQGGALDSCQLVDEQTATPKVCTFRTAARETVFPGYLTVYSFKDLGQEDEMDDMTGVLPALQVNSPCVLELPLPKPEQCFTQPPSRYSEAALVKALESNGVGRPSTFASIVKTILDRDYVQKQKSSLAPTTLGFRVNDYLVERFPQLFEVGFTAQMEGQLDEIEAGKVNWTQMMRDFYSHFQTWMTADGAPTAAGGVSTEEGKTILGVFPVDYQFDAPVAGIQRVYDDGKFVNSVRDQLTAGKKPLSGRQCVALLNLLAKYAARDAELRAAADAAGLGEQVAQRIAAQAAAEEKGQSSENEVPELPPEMDELLNAMAKVEWEKPTKRGKRTYDDGKFYRSIMRQVKVSHRLSAAQRAAVVKLAGKYAAVIPGFDDIFQRLNAVSAEQNGAQSAPEGDEIGTATSAGTAPAAAASAIMDPEALQVAEQLIEMVSSIQEWRPSEKRGSRSYDDKAFATSLLEQFQRRKYLSDKQIAALKKVLGHYADSFNESQKSLIATAGGRTPAEVLDEMCPECGKPLVRRFARSRSFIGCSGYPKCKFIKNS